MSKHPFNPSIKPERNPIANHLANDRARKQMSQLELETGHDQAWWDAWHAKNRERVRARFGKKAA